MKDAILCLFHMALAVIAGIAGVLFYFAIVALATSVIWLPVVIIIKALQ